MIGENSARIMITISKKNLALWRLAADDLDVPLTSVIRIAMREYIRNHKNELEHVREEAGDD